MTSPFYVEVAPAGPRKRGRPPKPRAPAPPPIELYWRPLATKWPKPETAPKDRKTPQDWAADWVKTPQKLISELERLKVREALVELDAPASSFRRLGSVGGLLSDAPTVSPKVLVTFHLPEVGEVQYPCDGYKTPLWNLHAIALTLELLRRIDFYDCTIVGQRQQYRGFKRLPGPAGQEGEVLSPMQAAERIMETVYPGQTGLERTAYVKAIMEDSEVMRLFIRKAERETHPDKGGSHEAFNRVAAAKAVLVTHHAGADQEDG